MDERACASGKRIHGSTSPSAHRLIRNRPVCVRRTASGGSHRPESTEPLCFLSSSPAHEIGLSSAHHLGEVFVRRVASHVAPFATRKMLRAVFRADGNRARTDSNSREPDSKSHAIDIDRVSAARLRRRHLARTDRSSANYLNPVGATNWPEHPVLRAGQKPPVTLTYQ